MSIGEESSPLVEPNRSSLTWQLWQEFSANSGARADQCYIWTSWWYLEELLIAPVGVEVRQLLGQTVVLTEEYHVYHQQSHVLVTPVDKCTRVVMVTLGGG